MSDERQTILDSCVLLNLAASDDVADIVAAIEGATFICTAAQKEALFLRDEADPAVLVPLNLEDLLAVSKIRVCDLATPEEEDEFVRLAADLDDGEAMSIVIATSRGMRFASDDQKARRVFLELVTSADRLTCTSSILKQWAETRTVAPPRLKAILKRISTRARFTPSRRDPNAEWWQQSQT
jgi:predicted nucleic acid-binding protein